MPAPLAFLAYLAGETRRIDLGTAVVETPHDHPHKLAEEAALVDRLLGGRLRPGVGSGAVNKPLEFARFGVSVEERGARALGAIEILWQALAGERVTFDGESFSFENVELAIRPLRPLSALPCSGWLAAPGAQATLAGTRYR